MAYVQAFAAYCAALQSLIDAGAIVSLHILNNLIWVRSLHFDGRVVTIHGIHAGTNEAWSYSYVPDYIDIAVMCSSLSR